MCEDFVRNASKKELNTINLFGIKLKVRPYLTPQNIKKNIINFIDEHMMFHKPFDGDVDIVFLWCSNQDKAWNEKRITTLKSLNKDFVEQAVCDGRFQDNEELRYALRSIEKNAPWINKIYIITDNQIPPFINLDNPKIKIIDHKEIIPQEYLPTFNSNAIESCIHKIPNLSEHFLYANDDTFFRDYVKKSFFFDYKGRPIARHRKMPHIWGILECMYQQNIIKMQKMIFNDYDVKICLQPHHNIDSYTKTICQQCENTYFNLYEKTRLNKFRGNEELQRSLILFQAIALGLAKLKKIKKIKFLTSAYIDSSLYGIHEENILKKIKKLKSSLICFNDSELVNSEQRIRAKEIFEKLYPKKSSYEKD